LWPGIIDARARYRAAARRLRNTILEYLIITFVVVMMFQCYGAKTCPVSEVRSLKQQTFLTM
jgi:hypothetical protein